MDSNIIISGHIFHDIDRIALSYNNFILVANYELDQTANPPISLPIILSIF